MRSVTVNAVVLARECREVFDTVADFVRYPDLVDAVRSVSVEPTDTDGVLLSHWEVYFRNGILRWSESDRLDPGGLRIDFDQTDGDFDTFRGDWQLRQAGADTEVVFHAEFDFGVPSLASIIDPVAVRVLTENMELILLGLFDQKVTFGRADATLDRTGALSERRGA
ncbi:MAG: type II toxin-antitoxin system RatA family toxin [Micromonosporaceae bacterium]